MTRRVFLTAAGAWPLLADAKQEIFDLFTSMASGLSEGNAGQFLRAFDPSMKGYSEFARNVRALLEQWDVLSAVDVTTESGDEARREVTLDWMLQISNKQDTLRIERRQETVKCQLAKKGKWRIVALDPMILFDPPKVR
jgi:hypothetical protein